MTTRKIILAIVNAAVVIVFFFSLFLAAASIYLNLSGKGTVNVFGIGFYEVVTDSMVPEINPGEVVLVRKVDPSQLAVGNNITFHYQGKINTHKIVSLQEDSVITQGVNSPGEDEPVPFDDIIGKVIGKSQLLGSFFALLRSWYGFFFLLIVPLFIFIGFETYAAVLKLKKMRNESSVVSVQNEINALKAKLEATEEKSEQQSEK